MTKIAFDLDVLNERAGTVASVDYARYGKQFSGIEPIFLYRTMDGDRTAEALERISRQFETVRYESDADKSSIAKGMKIDVCYNPVFRKEPRARVPGILNVGHPVFDYCEPFGDAWAYISRWLAQHASGGRYPYVPYILDMPEPDGDMRKELNIPDDAVVIGRYGAANRFDVPFVHRTIMAVLEARKDIYFLLANTLPFGTHERLIYLPVIHLPEEKARFIATCDWMLHARSMGESFGLAMAEFLALNRPVMCWAGGWDRNHVLMQPNKNLIYKTRHDLLRMLMMARRDNRPQDVRRAVQEFSPEKVWRKWEEVFLKSRGEGRVLPIPAHAALRRKTKNRFRKALSRVYAGL